MPEAGSAVTVAPGILWVRMPLPFALDHINIWLLEDDAGWTIVDTGIGSNRTREYWERIFASALGGKPVIRVIATHFHPDHVGLATWLVERWDAEFCSSLTEWLLGRALSQEDPESMVSTGLAFYRRAGLDDASLAVLAERGNAYARGVESLPPVLRRLREGDTLTIGGTEWRVIIGGGHSPEHVCLHSAAAKRSDRRRSGSAAHQPQHQRLARGTGCRPVAGLPGDTGAASRRAGRYADPAVP